MAESDDGTVLRSPASPSDWQAYFNLRWQILRQPWGQPHGSERDSLEDSAFHLLLLDVAGNALACGRLHFNAPDEAQVRYMAVAEDVRGRAFGSRILKGLEAHARDRGAHRIVLNSRDNAREFYLRHGYRVIGEAETLFGVIRHVRMEKLLSARMDRIGSPSRHSNG